jgi:biopolymer transport protein ExbD
MAEKRRFLDVWVVETNTVYREVPFTVVTDWIQQGRLLTDDKARPSGKGGWYRLGDIPAFAVYFPKPEPFRVEDQAEALEPVEVDLPTPHRRHQDEDDDPDMIPLIDITLVLLIFFMMTAAVNAGLFSPIDTPPAKHQLATIGEGMFWVGLDKDKQGEVRFSFGKDDRDIRSPARDFDGVRVAFKKELSGFGGEVKVRIRADKELPHELVKDTMRELRGLESAINAERVREQKSRVNFTISGEVSEPQ